MKELSIQAQSRKSSKLYNTSTNAFEVNVNRTTKCDSQCITTASTSRTTHRVPLLQPGPLVHALKVIGIVRTWKLHALLFGVASTETALSIEV